MVKNENRNIDRNSGMCNFTHISSAWKLADTARIHIYGHRGNFYFDCGEKCR